MTINFTITLPDFTTAAACAAPGVDPELFHSDEPRDVTEAKAICEACPGRRECAQWAMSQDVRHGVWGGMTLRDRHQVQNPNSKTWMDAENRPRRPCGSYSAFLAHIQYSETCDVCQAAQDARTEKRRRKQLADEHAKGGTATGAEVHRRLGEPSCVPCRTASTAISNAQRRARKSAARAA